MPRLPRILKIGLVAPFEGRYRYVGYDAIYAARMAVSEVNTAGGLGDGWYLDLVAYDDRADPAMARAAAHNLASDPDVVAAIGHYRQEGSEAVGGIYANAGIPWVVTGAWLTPSMTLTWQLAPAPENVADTMLEAASEPRTASMTTWGKCPLTPILASHIRSVTRYFSDPEKVYPSSNVLSTLSPVAAAERLCAWRDQGWQGMLVGDWNLAVAEFASVAGPAISGTIFVTPYPLPHDVAAGSWVSDYLSVGPHVPRPGPYALPTYEAVYVIVDALSSTIHSGAPPTRAHLAETLPGVHHKGLLGTVAWDERGFWQDAPLYLYRWREDGTVERF
ncbi:MAG: ABC transporter substrate-binding protein [Anaerolineae bacterium]|nr:ABC transporter substrate-binding protein [Anaerolineae bacterium]